MTKLINVDNFFIAVNTVAVVLMAKVQSFGYIVTLEQSFYFYMLATIMIIDKLKGTPDALDDTEQDL